MRTRRRRIRPGREMRRGLPCPSDSSREMARTRTWCGVAAPELALSRPAGLQGCWLALSLLTLSSAVGDLRVRLEEKKHRLQQWQTDKTVRWTGQWTGLPGKDMWLLAAEARVECESADFPSLVGWMWPPGDFVQAWHSSRRQLWMGCRRSKLKSGPLCADGVLKQPVSRRCFADYSPKSAAPPVDLLIFVLTVNSGLPSSLGSGKGQWQFRPKCFFTTKEKILPRCCALSELQTKQNFSCDIGNPFFSSGLEPLNSSTVAALRSSCRDRHT